MKRFLLFVLMGSAALASTAQTSDPQSVEVRGYQEQIKVPAKPYHMFRGDFDPYIGGYSLSNGEDLRLRKFGLRMYATVGDRPEKEIVAVSRNQFVARDAKLKITLNVSSDAEPTGEVLMVVPRQSASTANGGEVMLMTVR